MMSKKAKRVSGMTDAEYAACIYREVFNVAVDTDVYVRGVLDAVSLLNQRKQIALESRYRYGKTLLQVAHDIGANYESAASSVVKSAFRDLRCFPRYMRVSEVIKDKDALLEKAAAEIDDATAEIKALNKQIDILLRGDLPQAKAYAAALLSQQQTSITKHDFSKSTYNYLYYAKLTTIEMILAIDSLNNIKHVRNFGAVRRNKAWVEIIEKMKERGYTEWAVRMKAAMDNEA